jgi:hypothetical protein
MIAFGRVSRAARCVRPCLLTLALALAGAASTARGDTVTFAQFFDSSNNILFANNGTTSTLKTVTGGASVGFVFSNIAGLPSDLAFQNATMSINLTGTSSSSSESGNTIFQPLSGTISFTRTSAAGEGQGSRTNLLTITYASHSQSGSLSGSAGSGSASLSPSTPNDTVTYTSDFLSFSNTSQRNMSLSFTSVNPNLTFGANGVQNFSTAGVGSFASNPAPTLNVTPTPEPSTCVLIGSVAGTATLFGRWRRWSQKRTLPVV